MHIFQKANFLQSYLNRWLPDINLKAFPSKISWLLVVFCSMLLQTGSTRTMEIFLMVLKSFLFSGYLKRLDETEILQVWPQQNSQLKGSFLLTKNPTRKLAARTFIQSQYLKALVASLRVGFCDEWKRALKFQPVLENVRQRQQRRCQEILFKYSRRKFSIFCGKFLSKLCLQRLKFTTTISRIKLLLNLSI